MPNGRVIDVRPMPPTRIAISAPATSNNSFFNGDKLIMSSSKPPKKTTEPPIRIPLMVESAFKKQAIEIIKATKTARPPICTIFP